MANEEQKALDPQYLITEKSDLAGFQVLVNRYIAKWYVPYWPMHYVESRDENWAGRFRYQQALIDPLVLEKQQLTVRSITKWAVTATSTVTIPGTVNVSWCWW